MNFQGISLDIIRGLFTILLIFQKSHELFISQKFILMPICRETFRAPKYEFSRDFIEYSGIYSQFF